MRRIGYSAFIILTAVMVCWMTSKMSSAEENKVEPKKMVNVKLFDTYNNLIKMIEPVKKEDEEKSNRPDYKDIPLNNDVLDYLWDKSQETNFAYTYLLALAKTESEFNPKEKSSTQDHGLYQIHKPTDKWIAKELGLQTYNLYDPSTNIDFALFYLTYLRDYWRAQGASEEDVFDLVTISYNRGIEGCKRYLQHHSTEDNTYLRSVLKNKNNIEQNEVS